MNTSVIIPGADYDWRGLSIKQPAASFIIDGHKTIENRSPRGFKHNTLVGRWIFIHSSISSVESSEAIKSYPTRFHTSIYSNPRVLPMGYILGIARINGVYSKKELSKQHREWAHDNDACILFDVIIKLNDPVKTNGELGFWKMKLPAEWTPPLKMSKKDLLLSPSELLRWRKEQETKYTRKKFKRAGSLFRILLAIANNQYVLPLHPM